MLHWFRNRPSHTAAVTPAETRSPADPAPWLLDLFGASPALSGVTVSPTTAMRSPTVRACVEAISEAMGGLPVHVYQRDGDARERAPDHPAYALLHDEANDWTPASLFREQLTRDALLWGNGFGFINRQDGQPRELIRIAPTAITVELDRTTSEPTYRLSDGTSNRVLDRRDVIHIQAPSIDGVKGASPVLECKEAIGVNLTIEGHVARLFGRGARPSGVLSHPGRLGAEVGTRVKASWQATQGGGASGGTALLEEGMKFEPITLNSVDSQTLELWQHSILEICRVFRVPPHMVFELAGPHGAMLPRWARPSSASRWIGGSRLGRAKSG